MDHILLPKSARDKMAMCKANGHAPQKKKRKASTILLKLFDTSTTLLLLSLPILLHCIRSCYNMCIIILETPSINKISFSLLRHDNIHCELDIKQESASCQEEVIVSLNPCFDFRDGFFNWAEVRGVGWKKNDSDTCQH